MSEQRQLDLLVELAKLVRKFGPETFDSLARALSDEKIVQEFVDILSQSADAGRAARRKTSRDSGVLMPGDDSFRSQLIGLAGNDAKKRSLLLEIYDRLQGKSLLPSLADLRTFAADAMGELPNKSTRRGTLVISLMKSIETLGVNEIEEKLAAMESVSSKADRSLAGWSNVILDKTRRTSEDR